MHVLCPLFQLYKSLPPSSLRAMADVTIVQELVSHDPLGFIHFLLLSYVLPLQPPHPEYEAPNSESLLGFFLCLEQFFYEVLSYIIAPSLFPGPCRMCVHIYMHECRCAHATCAFRN